MALHELMAVTANNVANMSTPGYKGRNLMFLEQLNRAGGSGGAKVSQVKLGGAYRDLMQGTLSRTGNSLDVALQGDGYFAVQTKDGVKYTRAGNFTLNGAGEIITPQGDPVMGDGGPLAIQQGATRITITDTGTISTELGTVGKLRIVQFEKPQNVKPFGENYLDAPEDETSPSNTTRVQQGALEASNVQPVLEMNRMIEILRMYQSTQTMLNTDHELARNMIQKLTKA